MALAGRTLCSISLLLAWCSFSLGTLPGEQELLTFQRSHSFNDTKSDLIFLLDVSGSLSFPVWQNGRYVAQNGFNDEKVFVNSLLNYIRVSYPSTRVSVILFGSRASIKINYISYLSDDNHKCNFKTTFKHLPYEGGMTNMNEAFHFAREIIFGSLSGKKRPTAVVKTAVFLLTDGNWNSGGSPYTIAQDLRTKGIEIFAIGVTKGIDFNVLNQIASPGRAFKYSSFNQFREMAYYLRGDPFEKDWQILSMSECGSCDRRAKCACGLLSGERKCACIEGYYGSGYPGDCKPCPVATYKSFVGYAKSCTPCPAHSSHADEASTSKGNCKCNTGYKGDPGNESPCEILRCGKIPVPANAEIRGGSCIDNYLSTCEIACKEGYEISGSAVRVCQLEPSSNGKAAIWSGQEPQCKEINCPTLNVKDAYPKSGDCIPENSLAYKTKCIMTCSTGYVLKGSEVRTCQHDKTWSGHTVCEEIRCPKLNSIPLVTEVTPSDCIQSDMKFYSRCSFKCPNGYNMKAAGKNTLTRSCGLDGVWDKTDDICVDVTAPTAQCPDSISTNTSFRLPYAVVSWPYPVFKDNSLDADPLAELKVITNYTSPHNFNIGIHKVTYIVIDNAGKKSSCFFEVTVKDTEAPQMTSCPEDQLHELEGITKVRVTWKAPTFTDNSGLPPTIQTDIRPGRELSIGTHMVHYKAFDQSQNFNTTCEFRVIIKAKQCPKNKPPRNGALACNAFGAASSYCQISCQNGFDFAFPPASMYLCNSGKWMPYPFHMPFPWPDCSVRYDPKKAGLKMQTTFYYNGNCNSDEAKQQIKNNYIQLLKQGVAMLFGESCRSAECNAANVDVYCGDTDASRRRRRAVVSEVYIKVDLVAKEKPSNPQTLQQLESELDTRSRPVVDNAAKTTDWSPLRVSDGLDYKSYSLTYADAYCSDTGAVLGKCDSYQTDCDGVNKKQELCSCNSNSGSIQKCIRCPAGTFYNSMHENCTNCSPGTYQNQEGRFLCHHCPEGTWTLGKEAKNFTSCLEKCKPGYYSPNGLAKCFPCPHGSYAPGYMSTQCTTCPSGTTTLIAAATKREDCGMKCAPGTYSSSGVEPCMPCPKGTYQDQIGSISCKDCDGTLSTYGPGADLQSMCIHIDDCASNPCNNGGRCIDQKDGYECECQPGFNGKQCEINQDECLSDPCYQGSTCLDKVNDYVCVCAHGYSGKNCDVSSALCSPNPCQNGASCLSQGSQALCKCPKGYEGDYCEMKIDLCASSPCLNGGLCQCLADSFKCNCRPGYSGAQCELQTDHCSSTPCLNGGVCTNKVDGYSCSCKQDFTGAQCQQRKVSCYPNPCQNGACLEKANGYECSCRPNYAGNNCQTKVSPDFDITFPTSLATSYSAVTNILDLRAFTIAFWLRTSDQENPGTPVSYSTKVNGKVMDNALVLQDYGAFVLHINNQKHFIGVSANDGHWHHVAVTWRNSDGRWVFYLDGKIAKSSSVGFQVNQVIKGDGVLVLGQEQDDLGDGFSPEEAFVGDISHLNIWDRALSDNDIANLVYSCQASEGNVKAWGDFLAGLRGDYVVSPKSRACDFNSNIRGYQFTFDSRYPSQDHKVLLNKSPEECAKSCEAESSFPCRSFDYERAIKKCYLSKAVAGDGDLIAAKGFDFYQTDCLDALGVEAKAIQDSAMTATSSLDALSQPKEGRLRNSRRSGVAGMSDSRGGWSPSSNSNTQYLQVDLGSLSKVTGVATQGADKSSEWVTSYKLEYSADGSQWHYYPSTLSGNQDDSSIVRREVQTFKARYVRIRPQTWHGRIALRAEIYGAVIEAGATPTKALDIMVRSEGCEDPNKLEGPSCGKAYIQVDGKEHSLKRRGFNIVVLDGATGKVISQRTFDTHGSTTESNNAASYLQSYVGNEIVLAAIQDEGWGQATAALSTQLMRLSGVTSLMKGYRGSLAMVGYAGQHKPSWVKLVENLRKQGPTLLNMNIQPLSVLDIKVRSEGCEDPNTLEGLGCGIAYIQVNGKEHSLKRRGFNFVVLDGATGSVISRLYFDTHASTTESDNAAKFLQSLTKNEIVLAAIQDEGWTKATSALSTQLMRLSGVTSLTKGYRSSLAMMGYAGQHKPSWVKLAENLRKQGPTILNANIPVASADVCSPNPCANGATCVSLLHGYRCLCTDGYQGNNCQTESSCDDPGIPPNGKRSSSSFSSRSTITFTCNAGYKLQGSATITCNKGKWSAVAPRCIDIDECAQGVCSQQCTNTDGGFKCACQTGYQLNADRKTCNDINECSMSGMCSHSCHNTAGGFRCTCPAGMVLSNGGRSCKDTNECASSNHGCEHVCKNGYQTSKCHCRGGYFLQSDKKQCSEITCPAVSAPAHGQLSLHGDRILGNVLTVTCSPGYKLVGTAMCTCQADGKWSGKEPQCQAVQCPVIGTIKNGQTSLSSGQVYGSKATFTCNAGYDLVGKNTRTCQQNGEWSNEQPRCVRVDCPSLSAPVNGQIEGIRREVGSTVRISCKTGYLVTPDSSSFRACTSDHKWTGADPTCKLVNCGDPGTPWHGSLYGVDFTYSKTVSYRCRANHFLEGDQQRTCGADGKWTGSLPKCLANSCGDPGTPINGYKAGKNHTYGATINFTCSKGYTLRGSATRTCQTTGLWDGTQPTCQIKNCGDPGAPVNGHRFGHDFTYGKTTSFDCNPGYKLQGSMTRDCQETGTWSGSQPTCIASNCGKVVYGPSGTIQSTNYPNNYNYNEYCTWEIRVPVGRQIRIDFEIFRTEAAKDFVYIYDTGKPEPIVAFSGIKDKPRGLTSSGNTLRVRFISDGANVNNGFKLTFRQTDCGGMLTSSTGEIRSPGFPNGYSASLSCIWLIHVPATKIALKMPEFSSENAYDRLEVARGPLETAPLVISWSGSRPLTGEIVAQSYMWLHFYTNSRNDQFYKGFRVTYKPYNPYEKRK